MLNSDIVIDACNSQQFVIWAHFVFLYPSVWAASGKTAWRCRYSTKVPWQPDFEWNAIQTQLNSFGCCSEWSPFALFRRGAQWQTLINYT